MPDAYAIRKLAHHHYSINGDEVRLNPLDLAHHIMGLERAPVDPERRTPEMQTVIRATRLAKTFGGAVLRLEGEKWVVDPLEDGQEPRPSVKTSPSPTRTARIIAFPQKKP